MGADNTVSNGDRSSHYPQEESFMIDVSGQIKKDKQKKKIEQVLVIVFHHISVFCLEVLNSDVVCLRGMRSKS